MTVEVELNDLRHSPDRQITMSLIDQSQIDDVFRAQWRELEQNLEMPNPFFCSWFLEPAMKHLTSHEEVRLAVLRHISDGLLVGLVPLVRGDTYAKIPLKYFQVWLHDHCYNGVPLIRSGYALDVYGALFDWIDTHPAGARFLRFVEYPLTAYARRTMDTACTRSHRPMLIQYYRERAIISGRLDTGDVITNAFNSKKRKELRRQAKRLRELGDMEMRRLTEENEIIKAADAFVELEMSGWKGHREGAFPIGRSEEERAFFNEIIKAGARLGAVSCDQLSINGNPAAMFFTLRSGSAVFAFKITHDEKLNAYSPGVQILMEATQRMLEDKTIRYLDSCARSGHPVVDSLWRERMGVAQINIPAGGLVDGLLLRLCSRLEWAKNMVLDSGRNVPGRKHD